MSSNDEKLSPYDLRMRSIRPGYLCSGCNSLAYWSVWLHTPDWPANGGETRVLCSLCALNAISEAATDYTPRQLAGLFDPKETNGG